MIETQLTGESLDIVEENVEKMKKLFPEIITEDKIDFEKLKKVLGNHIEEDNELYNFTWKGKSKAIAEAQKTSTGTLRPCKEESKNWDTSENLYIEGDNLEVLKLLQKSYYGQIKMIYIDPPYNTGKNFIYKDDFKDNLENYLELTGQSVKTNSLSPEKEIKNYKKFVKLSTNTETSGRYHTNWLNMIYPRLKLARNLLRNDGLIFISIDDNEIENLKKICDEIFGSENFICNFVRKNKSGSGHDSKNIAIEFDYILCYCKNIDEVKINKEPVDVKLDKKYSYSDEYVERRGKYYLRSLDYKGNYSQKMDYPIKTPDDTVIYSGGKFGKPNTWRWSEEKFNWGLKNGFIEFKKNKNSWNVYIKQYQFVDNNDEKYIRTIPYRALINFSNSKGSTDFNSIMGEKVFSFPKPVDLIKHLVKIGTYEDSIIMDFFAGSSSTAHGIMDINSETNSKRKFINIQLPEPTNKSSEAYISGYENICEIGKERIRRAGELIKQKNKTKNLDIGFKVFKLGSTNFKKWDPDYANLEQKFIDGIENILPDRTNLDLIYEIMLKYGIPLTLPIEEMKTNNKTIYSIGAGALLICLDNNLTKEIANEIIKIIEQLKPETSRIVFKDNGFKKDKADSHKTNIKETLKNYGINEFITI